MARTHSYRRFSFGRQELGDSIRRQDDGLARFLKAGNHTLSDLAMMDKGKSAFRGNKQKCLNKFMEILRAKDGRIARGDILYVEAIDRLSRKGIRPTQDTVNEILNAGVDIAITLPLEKTYKAAEINDLGGAIELAAFAYGAHVYSKMLSGRTKGFFKGAREKAYSEGKAINSGSPPFWLVRSKGKFSFKEGAKETIRYILQRTIEGIGGKVLTRELNQKFPCFAKSGKWNERYMRAILNDRRILGEFQPNQLDDDGNRQPAGDVIPSYYPAATTEDVWRAANAASQNRRIERGPTTGYVNLFTGLVWHAFDKCPCHLYTYQQKRADGRKVIFRRLKSVNATDGIKGASTETICIHDFEHVVLGWLREIDLSIFDGHQSAAAELAALVAELEKKTQRMRLIESDEEASVSLLVKQLAKLREDCAGLKAKIDALRTAEANSIVDNIDHINRLAEMDNTDENRQMLREAIKRVVKRISILPVKLGSKRRDTVGSLIEMELMNGVRRQILQCGKAAQLAFTDMSPSGPPLLDTTSLTKRKDAVRKVLKEFMGV